MTQVEIRDVTSAEQYLRICIKLMAQGRYGNLTPVLLIRVRSRHGSRARLTIERKKKKMARWVVADETVGFYTLKSALKRS